MSPAEILNPELYVFALLGAGLLWFHGERKAMRYLLAFTLGWFLVDAFKILVMICLS